MKYRAEIDGLRAVAVLPVILFHAGFEWISGGYVGVDVFFVISGYLITTIIIKELDQGHFSLLNFYERRARRILPALFFVSLACLPFAWIWLTPQHLRDFGQSLVAVAAFSSNFLFWIESGYFDTAAEFKPLLHTWSLAVEEQYYILYPLFLLLTWRLGLKPVVIVLGVLFIVSLALAHWAAYEQPMLAFYLLPTRGWELVLGVFAALYLHRNPYFTSATLNQVASALGLLLILFAVFTFDAQTPFPSLYALIPTLGALLIILTAVEGTWVRKLLSQGPIVGLGLISYSAYLWHQPILAFARHRSFGEVNTLLLIGLCILPILMAVLSWHYIERPFRDRRRTSRRTIFIFSVAGICILFGFGALMHITGGLPGRATFHENYGYMEFGGYEFDNSMLQEESWIPLRELSGSASYGTEFNAYDRTSWFDPDDERPGVLLVGNSYSKDMFNVLNFSDTFNENFQLARFGAQIADIGPAFYNTPNFVDADIVMLVSYYSEADLEAMERVVNEITDHGKTVFLVHRLFSFYDNGFINLADRVILSEYDNEGFDLQETAAIVNAEYYRSYANNEYLDESESSLHQSSEQRIDEIVSRYPEVGELDRIDYICTEPESCAAVSDDLTKHFFDYGHHTLDGARFFARTIDETGWLEPLLE